MRIVDRVFKVIEALGEHPEGVQVVELATRLGLAPSTTHRILIALRERGYVLQDQETKRYRCGFKMFRFAARLFGGLDLRKVASPYLGRLTESTGLSSWLTMWDRLGREAICIDTVEGTGQTEFFVRLGRSMPLHCAASGKAIVAFLPPEEGAKLFANTTLERFTPRTCTDPLKLREEWKMIREQGYAVCDQELDIGVMALAAPIWDAADKVVGSVGVVGVSQVFEGGEGERIAQLVRSVGQEISKALGASKVTLAQVEL